MTLFPVAALSSLLFMAAASSAFLLPSQTQTGGGARASRAGSAGSTAPPFASLTSLASLSYRGSRGYSSDNYDDGWDDYGGGRRSGRNRGYDYGRGGGGSGVLARRRDGAYGSGYGRYYDDEFGYRGGGYEDSSPREFTPSERKGIRRLQQRRYGGGDYYSDDDYFGGRRGEQGGGMRDNYPDYGYRGMRDDYPDYGYGGMRGGRRGRRYGRVIGDSDYGYGSGGSSGYGGGGYGQGRRRGRNYDSYDDYDDHDDYFPERSYLDDRRYSSQGGRRRQGFQQWGNLVGGAARRSKENLDSGRRY